MTSSSTDAYIRERIIAAYQQLAAEASSGRPVTVADLGAALSDLDQADLERVLTDLLRSWGDP